MPRERAARALAAVAGLALLATLAGCGGAQPVGRTTSTPAASPASAPAETRPADGTVAPKVLAALQYETVKPADLPAQIAEWASWTRIPKTLPHARIGEYIYVMAAVDAGALPGGTVKILHVEHVEEGPRKLLRVEAVAEAGTAPQQGAAHPRTFIRVPWPASDPEPQVVIMVERNETVTTMPVTPIVRPVNPDTPVSSPPGSGTGSGSGASAGSGGSSPANPGPTQPAAPAAANPAGPLAFRPVDVSALPETLSTWRQTMEPAPTGAAAYADNALFVMAAAGEQRSGGYRVEIRSVEMKDGKLIVTAVLHKPAPGAMVTMAMTYPKSFARVELKGSGTPPVQVNWQ